MKSRIVLALSTVLIGFGLGLVAPELYLGRVAAQKGWSEAELIREAIRDLVRDSEPPRPRLPLFSSDDPTLARRFEEELRGFGE